MIAYLEPLFVPDHWQWVDWGTDKLGPSRGSSCAVDRTAFLAHFASLMACDGMATRRRFLCSVYIAHALTLGRTVRPRAVLVFPIHGGPLFRAEAIEADFPGALYLHMVRHPVSSTSSIVRHARTLSLERAFPAVARALVQVLSDRAWLTDSPGYGDRAYLPEIGARAKAFRLEALHERPRDTLEAICAFADLAWDEALLRSTFNGLQWWNRAESPRLSGFDPALPARGVGESTHAIERLAIRLAALPKLIAWRYPDAEPFARWPEFLVSLVFRVAALVPFRAEFAAPESSDEPIGRAWLRRYAGIRRALWRGYADSRAAAAITVTSGEAA
ncbi:MAG: sulfotransferase [Tagaea sp.]|nr:sulfotransferase [Tagaea sp.]